MKKNRCSHATLDDNGDCVDCHKEFGRESFLKQQQDQEESRARNSKVWKYTKKN